MRLKIRFSPKSCDVFYWFGQIHVLKIKLPANKLQFPIFPQIAPSISAKQKVKDEKSLRVIMQKTRFMRGENAVMHAIRS